MEHLETKTVVAIKERLYDSEDIMEAWECEINKLKLLKERIPHFTTARLFSVLDDSKKKIKNKYIAMEWIEGFFLKFFFIFFTFLFYTFFFH